MSAPGRPRWYRHGPTLFALGVLLTGVLVVAAVFAVTGDPRAGVRGGRAGADPSGAAGLSSPRAVADAAVGFVAGAKADITSVTQYDYRSLDVALAAGSDVTTGRYRSAYRAALGGSFAREARTERAVQTFTIGAAGIGTIAADLRSARVMVFGVQSLTRGSGRAVDTPVTLTVTMQRRGDRYLIADLNPDVNPGLPTTSRDLAEAAEAARRQTVADLSGSGRTGRVTALAVESATAGQVVVLVAGTSASTSAGRDGSARDVRLRVDVRRDGEGWQVVASQPALP